MSELDVVAELHHWTNQGVCPPLQVIRRARDEIVALRREVVKLIEERTVDLDDVARLENEAEAVRAEALEEAARACSRAFGNKPEDYAAAIRALKDRPGA